MTKNLAKIDVEAVENLLRLSEPQTRAIASLMKVMRNDPSISPAEALVQVFMSCADNKKSYWKYSNYEIERWCNNFAKLRGLNKPQ